MEAKFESLISELEKFITTKTVVGEPIVVGEVTLIPVQTVSFGFGAGGGGGKTEKDSGTGGGAAAGATMRPIAIVAVKGDQVQLFNLGQRHLAEHIAGVIPDILAKLKGSKNKQDSQAEGQPREQDDTHHILL